MKKIIFTLMAFAVAQMSLAQAPKKSTAEVSVVFGLTQPLFTNGFNFEVDVWWDKWMVDYSHGFGLEFTGANVYREAADQHLAFNITHSTGIGIGYRFTKNFNLRIEPKWHIWEMYYDDAFKTSEGKIQQYSTYTLGLGAYYRWTPFENKENALKGLTIAPNMRWWPNVGSTLENNALQYFNQRTLQNEIHQANNIGMGNTPFFVNVSIGYTFGMRGK
ncbi:MAG: hypothetical protein JJU28_06620 [Cyclobacteriaceae bacterium]|nr:hypothetical protein [Cyclobacteriaceae bacterium]